MRGPSFEGSLRVGHVAGVPVHVNASFFIGAILFVSDYFTRGSVWTAALGLALIPTLFVSIVVHEAAHALVGRAFGVGCRRIELNAFGGLAYLDRTPRNRLDEIAILVAGPCSNFLLALMCGAAAGWLPSPWARAALGLARDLNVAFFVFNMLPGLPLDGGRSLLLLVEPWLGWRWAGRLVGTLGLCVAGACIFFGLREPFLFFAGMMIGQSSLALLQER
jgi:Zn-dependent protease